MPPSRLSTVFDLSGLRLHTDGSLVLQSSKNDNLRFSNRTARNARGSWIAKDAGGLASVPRYRKVAPREEGEIEGERENEEMDAPSSEGITRSQAGKRDFHFKTSRARKRRKFATDEGYIASDFTPENYTRLEKDSEPESLRPSAPPSSDLLKYVHHHASMYYHERDLLLNASKQYRKDKKARKLARFGRDSNNVHMGKRAQSNSRSDSEAEEIGDDKDEESQVEENRLEDVPTLPARLADMYKTMDGSALMAIGMLLQEHVAELLYPQLISDWSDDTQLEETLEMNGTETGISPPVD